jgi:hypothetical protein
MLKEIDDYALEQMKRVKGEKDILENYLENPKDPSFFD